MQRLNIYSSGCCCCCCYFLFRRRKKSKVNETQVFNSPIPIRHRQWEGSNRVETKCIYKKDTHGTCYHAAMYWIVFTVVSRFLSGFVFVSFDPFFDSDNTHTPIHCPQNVQKKTVFVPFYREKESRSKTISCSHTKNCCLFVLRAPIFTCYNEEREKKNTHYMWTSMKLSTLLLCAVCCW